MEATAGLQMSQPRPRPCFASTRVEAAQLADAHQMEQLLARKREVLAEMVVDRDALARQLLLQELRRAAKKEMDARSRDERRQLEDILLDESIRAFRPTATEALELAGRLEVPERRHVVEAIKRLAKAKGHIKLRLALIELAALCIRWAGAMPTTNHTVGRITSLSPEAKRKREARERAAA